MRHALRWTALLLVPAVLLIGSTAEAQKKPNMADKDKDKEKDVTSEKMIKAGQLVGKVAAVYEDRKVIRLQVTVTYPRLNPGALAQMEMAQVQMIQARVRGDRMGMLQAQQSMLLSQATLYTLQSATQDVELSMVDDAIVRTASPREQFDEKGRVKRLTRAELKELKGDPKQPGYKAEFGDIATDQVVQVSLVRKKQQPVLKTAPKEKPKAKGKKKDKDADDPAPDVLGDNLPQVSLVMILADTPPR